MNDLLKELATGARASLKRVLNTIYYRGNEYACPFCGGRFRKFLPMGSSYPVIEKMRIVGAGRRNARCPVCGSNDRERLVHAYLGKHPDILNGSVKSILHVAPELNLGKLLRGSKRNHYIAGDKFAPGYKYSGVIELDLLKLELPDASFDVIVCNHVLEHIDSDIIAMRELYRVLKPGGLAILQVPLSVVLEKTYENPAITTPEERIIHFGQRDHVRIYGQDYDDRLRSVGFVVERIHLASEFPSYGLNDDEFLMVAKKV